MKQIVSYGAGTNSTAMVIDMVNHGERIDAIVFSDTGGERPETYRHLADFNAWLIERGYPEIETVKGYAKIGDDVIVETLEEECILRNQLPGIIYGFGSCSDKWKKRPFKRWLKEKGWNNVTQFIGFDAGEPYRAERGDMFDEGYKKRYWLIERGLFRTNCIAIIEAAGIKPPGKSACFFCPSSKKHEILELSKNNPALMRRALAMEQKADLTSIKGLGRSWSWKDLVEYDRAQNDLFETFVGIPCDCWDGA